jgi:hypothetical protein
MRYKQFFPHIVWLGVLILAFAAHWLAPNDPGRVAAIFINGIMASLFDPAVWLISAIPALLLRRPIFVFIGLLLASAALIFIKGWLEVSTGTAWIHGSIVGNFLGFVAVGYIINAIALVKRSRKLQAGT